MPKFSEILFGKSAKQKQIPTLTPQQQALQNQLIGGLGGVQTQGLDFISRLLSGDPEALSQFQAPALRQFQEQIIPGIAERFGGLGALRSSGFQNSISNAAAGLAENLSAQRAGLGLQGLNALQGLQGQALQTPFQTGFTQPSTGAFPYLLSGLGQGLGGLLGGLF